MQREGSAAPMLSLTGPPYVRQGIFCDRVGNRQIRVAMQGKRLQEAQIPFTLPHTSRHPAHQALGLSGPPRATKGELTCGISPLVHRHRLSHSPTLFHTLPHPTHQALGRWGPPQPPNGV